MYDIFSLGFLNFGGKAIDFGGTYFSQPLEISSTSSRRKGQEGPKQSPKEEI